MGKCANILNTSADSKYFSRAVNLICSVRAHSPNPPIFRVWDLGLSKFQKLLLRKLDVNIGIIPKFSEFYLQCYTWKLYIINSAPGDNFLHLDAGNTVFCDISTVFDIIEAKGVFFVDQGQTVSEISPEEYLRDFGILNHSESIVVAAGNIGFNRNLKGINLATRIAFEKAKNGYCLGFSKAEIGRANGLNLPVRDCTTFRHDQTVLNCSLRAAIESYEILPHFIWSSIEKHSDTKIHNQRKRCYTFIGKHCGSISFVLFPYCLFLDGILILTEYFEKAKRLICGKTFVR